MVDWKKFLADDRAYYEKKLKDMSPAERQELRDQSREDRVESLEYEEE
jgi:hypothetical protein